jgi:hypothetical protein
MDIIIYKYKLLFLYFIFNIYFIKFKRLYKHIINLSYKINKIADKIK